MLLDEAVEVERQPPPLYIVFVFEICCIIAALD